MRTGWLIDVCALDDRIVFWFRNGRDVKKIERKWTPSIYIASDTKSALEELLRNKLVTSLATKFEFVNRFEKVHDTAMSQVLKLTLKRTSDLLKTARIIEHLGGFGYYRLYNIDVPPEQTYLYENDLFLLGRYKFQNDGWLPLSQIDETDYVLPNLNSVNLSVAAKNRTKLAKFSDKIDSIVVGDTRIESASEKTTILECVEKIRAKDPDMIITEYGDSWDLPYLVYRAQKNKISNELVLGRDSRYPLSLPASDGTSFFAYGQVCYKPSPMMLLGRAHIDKSNCFLWQQEHSLVGLYEIARTCRLPLQAASRASIGRCMSSIQFYYATKRGLLIPWKPVLAEMFKTRKKLFIGDRGGLIIEPDIGKYENIAELDFVSLFAAIMMKNNVSAETIECRCCPETSSRVPELGYRICQRQGIVPESLEMLVKKRSRYGAQIDEASSEYHKNVYKQRKAALKWILVTSFGYLGFNNAKFGRIDAHMAVCAFARGVLKQAMRIAEDEGFCVLYGNVDSVWIRKNGATKSDYDHLRMLIEKQTGFEMSIDIYKWLVLLPSKENAKIPVFNRYFGLLQNGTLKVRGLESRRHDVPDFFKKCQMGILRLFARCDTLDKVITKVPEARRMRDEFRKQLFLHQIPVEELMFTNRLTRSAGKHKNKTVQADVVNQLKWEGRKMDAGEKIHYVITDNSRKISGRIKPIEALDDESYDAAKYCELLDECCNCVITPFTTDLEKWQ